MNYRPTEKVHCKGCGGWVAEVDTRTHRVVRVRNAHKMPPPERTDPEGDDEYGPDGSVVHLADHTAVLGSAWCASCKWFVEWPLLDPTMQKHYRQS